MTLKEKGKIISKYCINQLSCARCNIFDICYRCNGKFTRWESACDDALAVINGTNKSDPVNKPSHYTDGKIEVIDFIEDKKLGFCLGNAVKYISRAGKKDPNKEIEDLKKANWYINRRIKELEEVN